MKLSLELADLVPSIRHLSASHCVTQRHRSLTARSALQGEAESTLELEKQLKQAGFL
jgi:hypothetical protein